VTTLQERACLKRRAPLPSWNKAGNQKDWRGGDLLDTYSGLAQLVAVWEMSDPASVSPGHFPSASFPVCHDIADSLGIGGGIDAVITENSRAFDLVSV
jgi:hypothetical protein